MTYKLRYFFDFGSGVCLWSANDAAQDRFKNYPIDEYKLPVSKTLQKRIQFILAWHDTFLDWDDVPQPSQWCDRESKAFSLAAQEVLTLLRQELGHEFEIVDESGTAGSTDS
jgi:hypothetical protein